jgi:hypothetical protein
LGLKCLRLYTGFAGQQGFLKLGGERGAFDVTPKEIFCATAGESNKNNIKNSDKTEIYGL